ncbi:MAG: 4-hydroxy-tetrahydrodipicolinate synthase [Bacillota bacterium]|jgi:4-hydroxy-tetrahydrodipicolinate synthase|nr:4-hydroxy-tetrahydrodipicolinate synthase [Bacillota bacterium]
MRFDGRLARVITAMITPFAPDLSVDYAEARRLARHLVNSGSDGLVVCGTTGESPTLSDSEKLRLFEAVLDEVGDDALVVAGTGSNNTLHTLELTQAAARLGVHGAMLVTPYYNKPPQEGLYRHFAAVADKVDLPLLIYNVPGRTGCNLLPDTLARLAKDYPNVVAVKEASGLLDQVAEIRTRCGPGFVIYSGDDNLTLPIMSVGGDGIVSVASHIAGDEIQSMIRAFLAGDVARAAALHRRLLPLFKVMFVTTNPVPVKAAVAMRGFNVGGLRPPLVEATEAEKARIREVMESLDLL